MVICKSKLEGKPRMEMIEVGLVACAKTKSANRQPARDLYLSHLFLLASRYCEETYAHWFILSARYGLVHPSEILDPYDETLAEFTPRARDEWAGRVAKRANDIFEGKKVLWYYHAGGWYAKLLSKRLSGRRPLEGLGIGQQISWYLDRL